MTTLDVTLSSGFQSEVGTPGNGAWVYAIAYDADNTTGVITTLVADGSVEGSGGVVPVSLESATDLVSGKVYIVIQQSGATSAIAGDVAQQSDLNIANAAADHFVFDSMELNISGSPNDKANLTSVTGFTLPMELSAVYSNGGTVSDGYNVSGNSIIAALTTNEGSPSADIRQFLTGALGPDFQTALSPAAVISTATPDPTGVTFKSSNWNSEVNQVASLADTTPIVLSGLFSGTKDNLDIYHNSAFFDYTVTYDATATLTVGTNTETGVVMLVPEPNSQVQGVIAIPTAELEDSIYSTLGTAEIFGSTADVLSGGTASYTINTGANNQWGAVLRTFLVGFTAGYYGGTAESLNTQVTAGINLDNSINWDPTYAFGGTVDTNGTTSTLVHNSITVSGTGQVSFDPYAQVFYDHSNSYGSGYSDALMDPYAQGSPLLDIYDTGTTADVATLNLTLFADSEQPSGYTTPEIHNYIAPPGGTYGIPDSTPPGIDVQFYAAAPGSDSVGLVLNPTATVTLDILTSDTSGVPSWDAVTLDGATSGGLWQKWDIGGSASSGYTATATGATLPTGNFMIVGFPVVATGTATEWYRLGVGSKTFDLYTVTQNGSFDNPTYTGANQTGSLAVDGLGTIALPKSTAETIPTFNVNLATGSGIAVDPSQMVVSTSLLGTQPDAPVAGVLNNGTFMALASQTLEVSNTITASTTAADLSVAFGWTGVNNSTTNTASWISGFTNKVGALDTVEVTISLVGGGTTQTATAIADLDGDWQTGTVALGAGSTYDITMEAFRSGVTGAVTPTSQKLELDLACFAAGTRILTARGEVAVEDLAEGDLVWARGAGLTPISWIGWRHVECHAYARPRDVAPVRVLRGAFARDVPHRDLLLSPDHAVFVDGVLIPVRYLKNGRTVRREAVETVTYYHVELARHDVILAEGLACESYLDTGNRAIFANADGAKADDAFALGVWERDSCAPLVLKGEKLAGVRRLLLERAEELGFAMTRDPALCVVADGRVVRGRRAGRVARFRLPASARDLRLVSRSGVPAQTSAAGEDHRQLGVAVSEIRIDGEMICLGDARLGPGWHRLEHGEGGEAWRWTDGEASLALAGGRVLEVELALTETYWRDASAEEIA